MTLVVFDRCPVPGWATELHDFGAVAVGGATQWERHFRQDIQWGTTTLNASWTPPNMGNLSQISPAENGPFKFTYGQHFELRSGEHQKTAVEFTPRELGTFRGLAYYWWDHEGDFRKEVAIKYKGQGVLPGNPAPAPGLAAATVQANTSSDWSNSTVTVNLVATAAGPVPSKRILRSTGRTVASRTDNRRYSRLIYDIGRRRHDSALLRDRCL